MLTGKSLTGQVAIVTGASRGIGKAVAQALAAEGATVIINYNGSAEAAEAVATDIRSHGGMAETVKCNVTDFAESEAFVKAVTGKYGRVDILVNNAGITRDNLIVRMTEEEFNAVLDTNLKGAFHMIRHLTKTFMKQRYGKIINISSVSGIVGNAGQANYSASKAGLIGLTKSVARELASRNICVNAVAPGFIRTDMTDRSRLRKWEDRRMSHRRFCSWQEMPRTISQARCCAWTAVWQCKNGPKQESRIENMSANGTAG